MAEGPREDPAEGDAVRRRWRRGDVAQASVSQPWPEGARGLAAAPPMEERFRQMHLRKQVSYR